MRKRKFVGLTLLEETLQYNLFMRVLHCLVSDPVLLQGHVRFKGDGSAKRAMDSLLKEHGGKLEIRGVETILRVVEGKEEEEYWKKVSEERKKTKAKKGQKRGRGRGGRGGSAAKRPRRNEN
jgi:hypothetical protein